MVKMFKYLLAAMYFFIGVVTFGEMIAFSFFNYEIPQSNLIASALLALVLSSLLCFEKIMEKMND